MIKVNFIAARKVLASRETKINVKGVKAVSIFPQTAAFYLGDLKGVLNILVSKAFTLSETFIQVFLKIVLNFTLSLTQDVTFFLSTEKKTIFGVFSSTLFKGLVINFFF